MLQTMMIIQIQTVWGRLGFLIFIELIVENASVGWN